ncbi:hypothetical protein EGW08_001314, partial [Elysia chlorotica]
MSPSKGVLGLLFVLTFYSSGSEALCNGTGSSVTVTTTETNSVYNVTTGLWVNVTTSGQSTVIRPDGLNSSNCTAPPPPPPPPDRDNSTLCNGTTTTTTVLVYETKSVYNETTDSWVNVTVARNQTVIKPQEENSSCAVDAPPPPDRDNSTLCNGTRATTTVSMTETKLVFNSTTGRWENVTTTRTYTVIRPPGSNSSVCDIPNEEWKAYVYFKKHMMDWNFKQWVDYFKSISENEWDFDAFIEDLGDNVTDIKCNASSPTSLQISSIMNVFDVLKDIEESEERMESCRWLRSSLLLNHQHWDSCMDDDDDDDLDGGVDSSNSNVMRRRLRVAHTAEMAGLGEVLCALPFTGSETVWTDMESDKTCDLWAIRNIILASLHIKLGWDEDNSCKEATVAMNYLRNYLEPCNGRLRFLLATLIRQAEMRQRMVCTPPTCNIPYASTCALDAEMRLRKFMDNYGRVLNGSMETGKNQSGNSTGGPMKGEIEKFCRDVQVTFACVANHTISCDADTYGSVNMRVKMATEQFRTICKDVITLPPEKCVPPPAMPVGSSSQTLPGGRTNGSIASNAELIRHLSLYSLFEDRFLCQAALRTDAVNDKELIENVCGYSGADTELRCLSRTLNNSVPSDERIVTCKGTRSIDSRCLRRYNEITGIESARCASPRECSLSPGTNETLACCDVNQCNHAQHNFSQSCPCRSENLNIIITEGLKPDMNIELCLALREKVGAALQGCSNYTRNMFTVGPLMTMLRNKCPGISVSYFLLLPQCGNACPNTDTAWTTCTNLGFSYC